MHSSDLSGEFNDEELPSLAQRLWSKLAQFRLTFQKANNTPTAAVRRRINAIKPFLHLLGTTHYDPDDGEENHDVGVLKVDSVVVEHYNNGDEVVVYRCKYNEMTRTWNPVNMDDPIRVADVVQYGNNKGYNTKKKRILSLA